MWDTILDIMYINLRSENEFRALQGLKPLSLAQFYKGI
jgi:hypothetical protein